MTKNKNTVIFQCVLMEEKIDVVKFSRFQLMVKI